MATHDYRITNYSYIHSHNRDDFQAFLDVINPNDGNTMLEAFCGYGETTEKLIQRESAMGISCNHYLSDISQVQINRAREVLGGHPFVKKIDLSDAMNLPYVDEMFDIVVVKMGLHEVDQESQELIMNELLRVTKKGGKLVIWEIALPDYDFQQVFKSVINRKNELAGFYDINRNRYYPLESDIEFLFRKSGFSRYAKTHDIWYLFESSRRKEEMVSVEKKILEEITGGISIENKVFLETLSRYRLEELNKSIREIVPEEMKKTLKYHETSPENITFLAHKAIFYGIK